MALTLKPKKVAPHPQEAPTYPYQTTFARDMVPGTLYVNFERVPRILRLIDYKEEGDQARVQLWSEYHREWVNITIPGITPMDNNYSRIKLAEFQPGADPTPEERAAKAAHLRPFQKERAALPEPAPADGGRVFEGKLGDTKVLLDAGSGEVVAEWVEGESNAKDQAGALGKLLVKRSEATTFAAKTYERKWAEMRGRVRAG